MMEQRVVMMRRTVCMWWRVYLQFTNTRRFAGGNAEYIPRRGGKNNFF
jgi:hypothetical protein